MRGKRSAMPRPNRPRRSVLYVPATSADALAKVATRGADTVIVDLEDSVAPDRKAAAREAVAAFFASAPPKSVEWVIRVNAASTEWGSDDLTLAGRLAPDAILLPKVETPRDLLEVNDALDEADVPNEVGLWAMIETPRAVLNIGAIAELGRDRGARLACFVAGTNDLAKETGVAPERRLLTPWLMQVVLGAKAGGLAAIDSVYNDFRDTDGFARDCAESAAMGFDGRTLIHPAQVDPANRAYAPSPKAFDEASRIVAAFALPENAGKGAISLDGRMVERLHLAMAERLLAGGDVQTK
jgi:citrate lyase subunit beta/citryl-CoA lyase